LLQVIGAEIPERQGAKARLDRRRMAWHLFGEELKSGVEIGVNFDEVPKLR
jgi:hypothetical protein